MKTSKLKLNPHNPRRISPEHLEKLATSIQQFPKMMELRPIIYDPETMQVLGGNQRLLAIRNLKMAEIPDTWAKSATDLTPEEKKEFILKDNIPLGEWNFDLLTTEFADFDLQDFGIEMPELNIEETPSIDKLLSEDGNENKAEITCPKCGFTWKQ